MKTNQLTLFIIDDEIPKVPKYVSKSVYQQALNTEILFDLSTNFRSKWIGTQPLRELIIDLLESSVFKQDKISIFGYAEPALALNDIDNGIKPDIIVYDWEYNSHAHLQSQNWLIEIFKKCDATAFVYSNVRDSIPPYLNKKLFDEFAPRFQLFSKVSSKNQFFSSEEFILQYILSRVSENNEIKIQGRSVTFQKNGYLNAPKDIQFLEKILGRASLLEKLNDLGNLINDNTIENLLSNINGKILLDEINNVLITEDSPILIKKYNPGRSLTYFEVAKKHGVNKLMNVLELGITKI